MLRYSEQTSERLLKVLVAAGRLPDDEVSSLKNAGGSLNNYLSQKVAEGLVEEDTLVNVLVKGFSLRRANLASDALVESALTMLPRQFVNEHGLVAFNQDDRFLKLAVVDPASLSFASDIQEQTGLSTEFFLCSSSEFDQVWQRVSQVGFDQGGTVMNGAVANGFGANGASHGEQGFFKIKDSAVGAIKPAANAPDSNNALAPSPQPEEKKGQRKALRTKWPLHDEDLVVDFCDQVLRQSIHENCSDIHIESFRDNARVRMRRDGALQVIDYYNEYLFRHYAAITTRFKIMAGCDISEKRLAQDGAITIEDGKREIDFRFNAVPTKNGERIVMRILAGDAALALEKIGFSPQDYKKVVEAITAPQGMVLVTGPTGSGKTTTLYGALQFINSPEINILTAEDPVEYYLEGAGQVQANEKIGLSFSSILRAFLRQDPEVILVGEIRDQETIDIAVKAALTGHLLLSTLHTNDAVSSITRMLNMGVPNFMISSALSLIVAQRLARKNCTQCLEPDPRATPEALRSIGFTDEEIPEVQAKRGAGCPRCGGSGLKGRRGIYEVLKKTKDIEEAILRNDQAPALLAAARKDGFRTMQEVGRDLIRSGEISIEEYQHTLVVD